MFSLAYTISDELQAELAACETLRRQILLTPLPPKTEFKLRWQAQINRIQDLMNYLGFPTAKNEILPILVSHKISSSAGLAVLSLRASLDYLYQNWTASPKSVTLGSLDALVQLAPSQTKSALNKYLRKLDKPVEQLLSYVQAQNDPAVLSAAITQAQIALLTNTEPAGLLFGRLLAYLFLFKGGYDLRGFLVLGGGQKGELDTFLEVLSQASKCGNATHYLVWFTRELREGLTRVKEALFSSGMHPDLTNNFWELNHRQEEILVLLENPAAKITNRDIQKRFKISQITASRDLAKLTSLNLVYPHGKGRSVYYTKI